MGRFQGPVKMGYGFLQSFKTMSKGLSYTRKIQVFSGLLEDKALLWFLRTKFGSWLELKQEFIQTWCVLMTSTNVIVEVAKVVQKNMNIFAVMLQSSKNITGSSKGHYLKRQL